MTQSDNDISARDEAALEDFFAAARAARATPDAALMDRILADAAHRMPGPGPFARLRRALEPLGGLPGLAALTACAALGIGLGYTTVGLDGVLDTAALATGFDTDNAMSLYSFDTAALDDLEG